VAPFAFASEQSLMKSANFFSYPGGGFINSFVTPTKCRFNWNNPRLLLSRLLLSFDLRPPSFLECRNFGFG